MSKVKVHQYIRSCTTNRDNARGSKLLSILCLSLISILTITRLANSGPWLLHLESPKITSQLCTRSVSEIKTVMLVFGTRPEAVKMAPVIMEISKRPDLRSITVSTGQHKEMLRQVLLDFDLQDSLDYELNLMSQGQTLSELSARAITSISSVISTECPDVVLVQGDTTTAFMAALAAFYAKVPVGHIEAGLRTHDIYAPFPEEVNRQSISTMSTFNFAPTELAAENLRSEGRSKNVFCNWKYCCGCLENHAG
jgi:hypothetical protein